MSWKPFKMLARWINLDVLPSDKKQLYLLILWISFAPPLGPFWLLCMLLISQSTAAAVESAREKSVRHAMPSTSVWITAHGISGSDFSFFAFMNYRRTQQRSAALKALWRVQRNHRRQSEPHTPSTPKSTAPSKDHDSWTTANSTCRNITIRWHY